ncbi:MAG: hypothetical protein FJ009_11655 [Chloroflexi bacterium]|nr:hypothetical protein [Chloroflexota bacterium]
MPSTATADTIVIERRELKEIIREVLREELARFAMTPEENWEIEEGSPLWENLIAIKQELREGKVRLLTHKEVFGNDEPGV